jgi:cell division transport system permease protein
MSRHLATSLGSLLSLTLLYLLFDMFWIAAVTSDKFYSDLISEIRMDAIVDEAYPDSTLAALEMSLGNVPGVVASQSVSREDARDELARLVGVDLLVGYDSINPLPRSFVIEVDSAFLTAGACAGMEEAMLTINGISEVHYSRRWLDKAESTRSLVLRVGMVLGVLIVLTALISSANNIRLMTEVRAVGLQQMRLLGAGRLFLALPYLFESLLVSILAAMIGWVAILYYQDEISFTYFQLVLPRLSDMAVFVGVCGLLGWISGYVGIRKLLK